MAKREEEVRKLTTVIRPKSRQRTPKLVESEQLSQVNLEIRTGTDAVLPMSMQHQIMSMPNPTLMDLNMPYAEVFGSSNDLRHVIDNNSTVQLEQHDLASAHELDQDSFEQAEQQV